MAPVTEAVSWPTPATLGPRPGPGRAPRPSAPGAKRLERWAMPRTSGSGPDRGRLRARPAAARRARRRLGLLAAIAVAAATIAACGGGGGGGSDNAAGTQPATTATTTTT